MSMYRLLALGLGLGLGCAPMAMAAGGGVKVAVDEAAHRVDITVDGKPFTSYLWQTNQRKPVLYPLIAPDGTTVSRGYPFALRAGERVDHPHHAGLWFNYGNANGFDFWNNSDAIPQDKRSTYGSVHQERIVSSKSGADAGELVTESTWIEGDAVAGNTKPIMTQTTTYVFSKLTVGGQPVRAIDLVVTLKALDGVVFHDDKEGLLGIRVAHFLESPTEKGGVFMDANGNPTQVAAADPAGASGVYHARAMVHADRADHRGGWRRGEDRDDCDPRPCGKSGRLAAILACARVWIVCCESAGGAYLRYEDGGAELYDCEGRDGDVSVSRAVSFERCERRGDE